MGEAPLLLADDALTGIVVTDSVPPFRLGDGRVKAKLVVLADAPACSRDAIRCIHDGGSIVELLEG